MEATGAYRLSLADFLSARGFHVSVVNPAQIAAFGNSELSRTKTDKADAKRIARFALALRPPAWTPPPADIRERQALLRRLESLQEMEQMELNREATADAAVTGSIRTVLATLAQEIKAVRKAIGRHIDGHPGLKARATLLESIPGVGEATAAWLLTLLSEHRGLRQPKAGRGLRRTGAEAAPVRQMGRADQAVQNRRPAPAQGPLHARDVGPEPQPRHPRLLPAPQGQRQGQQSLPLRRERQTHPHRLRPPQIRQALRPPIQTRMTGKHSLKNRLDGVGPRRYLPG
jgi:hypothetical protein